MHDDLPIPKRLREAMQALRADPKDLSAAVNVWRLCNSEYGDDLRSIGWILLIFKECALTSADGVLAMAGAYREVYELSGVVPAPADFDARLLTAFRKARFETSSRAVQWVLDTLKAAR